MQTYNTNYPYKRGDRLPPAKAKRRFPILSFMFLLLMIGSLVFIKAALTKPTGQASIIPGAPTAKAFASSGEEPQQEVLSAKTVDVASLKPSLDATIKKYPYTTSISVIDINSGNLVQSGDGYPFIAASTTKLLTAMMYLKGIEKGTYTLDTPVGGKPAKESLQLLINQSDNAAWDQFNTILSKEGLQQFAKEQGVSSYDVNRNTISSNDMAQMLRKLYKREILNDEHTKMLFSWMQNTSEERFIPAGIPKETKLYHKAGYLAERVHDVAIVDNGKNPYVIVIYSKTKSGSYDYELGKSLYKESATLVNGLFNQ